MVYSAFNTLKTKIWLTVLAIVLLFTFFTLYYFPMQQGRDLMENYNSEVQNFASTVALGVRIALNEQNYEGVQTAMEFVKGTPGLKFVSLLQADTVWNENHEGYKIKESVFMTFPEGAEPDPSIKSGDSIIVKRAPFESRLMSGSILLGYSTDEIRESQRKVRQTSLIVSGGIFVIGLLIGFWLARQISVPVRALRDAARKVGQGDLSSVLSVKSGDEIGELSEAFNVMVSDIAKARSELNESNQALSNANSRLNRTLEDLNATQAQLIQSEKMASLGELTAGIAHEIQNPLNFVNNFSDVNKELIAEISEEMAKGNYEEVSQIAADLASNEEKINYHGKRADAIVKSMLQHSRANSSHKDPTDINALVHDYLRIAYHGVRAREKSFNVSFETDFDPAEPQAVVAAQDVGRVLLNLFNNAFSAVHEKQQEHPEGYDPVVWVTTRDLGDRIEIIVKDNGKGIPDTVKGKIFQPFFTTKPTGQGTGLGLSLSYDIINAHGGEIVFDSKLGEGSEFRVFLPVKTGS